MHPQVRSVGSPCLPLQARLAIDADTAAFALRIPKIMKSLELLVERIILSSRSLKKK
ncbi:hypothetical protein N183_00480 [Sinorhizobium sp. Sb3]|nr:hypothetical protein N183_00480 [Sinorhizobium sp. Sb3]